MVRYDLMPPGKTAESDLYRRDKLIGSAQVIIKNRP